jgi:hypothetical protein
VTKLVKMVYRRIIKPLAVPGSGGPASGGPPPAEDLPYFTIMFR